MEEHIKANAEMVVEQLRPLSDADFGYTRESVEWLEGYVERLRNSGQLESSEMRNKLTSVFGSFLGECVVRCYGGRWRQHEGVWCVAFDGDNIVFPFAKIAKQIDNGLDDGIASFFNVIPTIFNYQPTDATPTDKKPWWKVW